MTRHPIDDLEAFALGDLDRSAAAAVLEHADACPTCAALLADSMTGVAALARVEESTGAFDLGRPFVDRSLAPRFRRVPWATAAAMAAAIGLFAWNVQLRATQPIVPIDALVHSHFAHHSLRGSGGDAKVIQATDGSWIYVVADGLVARSDYSLWELRGGSLAKLGDFVADPSGRATAFWHQAPGAVRGFSIQRDGRPILTWP